MRLVSALLSVFVFGCGDDCPPLHCSPAVIVTATLSAPATAPLEGSIRLCHMSACVEGVIALEPDDAAPFREVTFGDETFTSARFSHDGTSWMVEAEVHPTSADGYAPGDKYSVRVRDAMGEPLLEHEGVVSDKLQNDACGLPCAIQRVEI